MSSLYLNEECAVFHMKFVADSVISVSNFSHYYSYINFQL